VGTATMSKQKGTEKSEPTREEPVTVKAYPAQRDVFSKLAAMRKISIPDLLAQPDVVEFFSHLLIAEMSEETERLQGRKKP
jgi:hypothetical protein